MSGEARLKEIERICIEEQYPEQELTITDIRKIGYYLRQLREAREGHNYLEKMMSDDVYDTALRWQVVAKQLWDAIQPPPEEG